MKLVRKIPDLFLIFVSEIITIFIVDFKYKGQAQNGG